MEPNTGASTTSDDDPGSICPQGWTLPPNAGDGSYYNLLTTTYNIGNSGSKLVAAPFDFAYTGSYLPSSGTLNAANNGRYWLNTASSDIYAYGLDFINSNVIVQSNFGRSAGLPVRCVEKNEKFFDFCDGVGTSFSLPMSIMRSGIPKWLRHLTVE